MKVLNSFYQQIRPMSLEIKCVFKHQYLQFLVLNETNTTNCHSLEVVGRGSETQLQGGENSNQII